MWTPFFGETGPNWPRQRAQTEPKPDGIRSGDAVRSLTPLVVEVDGRAKSLDDQINVPLQTGGFPHPRIWCILIYIYNI